MAPLRVPQENGEWLNIDDEIAAAGGPKLLGPFTVNYNDPDIADGALIHPLAAGAVVLCVWCFVETAWDGTGNSILTIALGDEDYGPPDDNWGTLADFDVSVSNGHASGFQTGKSPLIEDGVEFVGLRPGRLTTAGALVSYQTNVTPAQGEAHIYALVQA